MLKASHQEHDQVVGSQIIHLMPGQFIFGRKAASIELNMTERQVRTSLNFCLNVDRNMTIQTTNKFSIINLENWDTYQTSERCNGQQDDQPVTNKGPASDQQRTTNKNGKKGKKEKENISIPPNIENVRAYCLERGKGVDPHVWFNHYQAKGWMIGKNKMKDWKAAVRTWEKDDKQKVVSGRLPGGLSY